MKKLRVLDLFSGIGGFSLGLERTGGFETVAFCEIEDYPRKVLNKHWPNVPLFDDVRKLKGEDVGPVDVICGGYPCQPFSTAGKRGGEKDDRHLWPEFNRLVAELRPTWVIGENVAGHISLGLDDVLSDLEGQGYACRTFVIPACAVAAHHRRDRCWTLAHAEGERRGEARQNSQRPKERFAGASALADPEKLKGDERECTEHPRTGRLQQSAGRSGGNVPYTNCIGFPQPRESRQPSDPAPPREGKEHRTFGDCIWLPEPAVGRVAHGVPNGVDRLKALGNAVVPQIPEMIGHAILASMQNETEAAE